MLQDLVRKNTPYPRVLLITGHLREQIRAHFGSGAGLGLQLDYLHQPEPQGTGAATLLAESFVGQDSFVLGWGDIIVIHDNYQALAASYREEPVDGLLLLEYVQDPHAGAAVYVDGRRVTAIVERPPAGSSGTHWNQAGLSVYTPEKETGLVGSRVLTASPDFFRNLPSRKHSLPSSQAITAGELRSRRTTRFMTSMLLSL